MPVSTSKESEVKKLARGETHGPEMAPKAEKPTEPKEHQPARKKSQEWMEPFILRHPDATPDSPIETVIEVLGERVRIEGGFAVVRDEKQRDALVLSGWAWENMRVVVPVEPRWETELRRFKESQK